MANARTAWQEGRTEEALLLLQQPVLKEDVGALFLMGEIYYNSQKWGAALNSFNRCLQRQPDLQAAQTYVDMIKNILSFFHTDQFNP